MPCNAVSRWVNSSWAVAPQKRGKVSGYLGDRRGHGRHRAQLSRVGQYTNRVGLYIVQYLILVTMISEVVCKECQQRSTHVTRAKERSSVVGQVPPKLESDREERFTLLVRGRHNLEPSERDNTTWRDLWHTSAKQERELNLSRDGADVCLVGRP